MLREMFVIPKLKCGSFGEITFVTPWIFKKNTYVPPSLKSPLSGHLGDEANGICMGIVTPRLIPRVESGLKTQKSAK